MRVTASSRRSRCSSTTSSGARAKITEAMQDTSFDGVTGHVSFDKFGDATNKQLTVYKVLDGAWTPVKTGTYTG